MANIKLLEMARRQANSEPPRPRTFPEPPTPPSQSTDPNLNLADYIILESRTHGSYSYPDLLVAKQKTHHSKNWFDAYKALHQENSYMLTIRQFVDFLNLLKSDTVYEGTGSKLPQTELDALLDEILTVRSPWRAEWLDADFKVVNKKLHLNYNHRTVNGELKPQVSEPLEKCLMTDKTPGIDLEDWLQKANGQGLPPKKTKNGSIWYWCPRSDNNSVARFWAYSGRAFLLCCRIPSCSSSDLGVRTVRTK